MPQGKYPRRQWPEEVIRYIVKNASEDVKISDMKDAVNRKFKTNYTRDQIKGQYVRRKLPFANGHRHNILMTDEMAEYLISIIPGRTSMDCVNMLNKKYGTHYTLAQIRTWKKNHKVQSGYDSRWRPGQPSWITGKKFPGRTNSGCWTEGHISANAVPVGTERITDGYTYVKVKDGYRQRNWRPKHHLVWEAHNGPLSEGYNVIFLDRNKQNFDINNLALVTDQELAYAARYYGMTDDPEINKSIVAASQLSAAIKNRQKNK